MTSVSDDLKTNRLVSAVLTRYYVENKSQAQIARELELSTAKVNRLLKQAREQGLVEIIIHTPYKNIFDIEQRLCGLTETREAIVMPRFSDDSDYTLEAIGREAADCFLQHLKDGDTICMGGGRTLQAFVEAVAPKRRYAVRVVPAIGGVQGNHHTDVNYLVAELARKLGGQAYQLHAPAFVDTKAERDALLSLRQVSEILALARQATIAIVGVGSVTPLSASYFQFTSLDTIAMKEIIDNEKGAGEILANIYNTQGQQCAPDYAERVIALGLAALKTIPLTMGVAASHNKILPLYGALRGGLLDVVITDEGVATAVLEQLESK